MRSLKIALALSCVAAPVHAQFMPYREGCPAFFGPMNVRLNSYDQSLKAGEAITLRSGALPVGVPATMLIGFSRRPVPIDLTPFGAPGCRLFTSGEVAEPMTRSGADAVLDLVLPEASCLDLHAQVVALAPSVNALGVVLSKPVNLALDAVADSIVHRASRSSRFSNWTRLDEPTIDKDEGALPFVTQVWNPGGGLGVYNPHEVGVWYERGRGGWTVFNQDQVAMPDEASFHVFVPNGAATQYVHTSTLFNRSAPHRTQLDHPELNRNPNAMVFVTSVYAPTGRSGVYNDHPIAVSYSAVSGRWEITNTDRAEIPFNATFHVLVENEHLSADTPAFVHRATPTNTTSNYTVIDHPALNGRQNAKLLVTQRENLPNQQPIGVFYSSREQRWAVFNENLASMTLGAEFNILPVPERETTLGIVHDATAANLDRNVTFIDARLIDRPEIAPFTTQNWNPDGQAGVYNRHHTGIFYSGSRKRWAIFNQDRANMPSGASFNVLVPNPGATQFLVTATAANTNGHEVVISHPSLNGNSEAIVFVEQQWGTQTQLGPYNDASIGVYYAGGRWRIFNQGGESMPANAVFRVLVADGELDRAHVPFVHLATTPSSNSTRLDHPALNGNPNAKILVTQNWRGVYNDAPIGVYYDGARWRIFNQIGAMPRNAAFNVLIIESCR